MSKERVIAIAWKTSTVLGWGFVGWSVIIFDRLDSDPHTDFLPQNALVFAVMSFFFAFLYKYARASHETHHTRLKVEEMGVIIVQMIALSICEDLVPLGQYIVLLLPILFWNRLILTPEREFLKKGAS